MSMSQLGSSEILAALNRVTAKTPIQKNSIESKWSFRVLLDGTWFPLEYDSEAAALVDYNSFS